MSEAELLASAAVSLAELKVMQRDLEALTSIKMDLERSLRMHIDFTRSAIV